MPNGLDYCWSYCEIHSWLRVYDRGVPKAVTHKTRILILADAELSALSNQYKLSMFRYLKSHLMEHLRGEYEGDEIFDIKSISETLNLNEMTWIYYQKIRRFFLHMICYKLIQKNMWPKMACYAPPPFSSIMELTTSERLVIRWLH